LSICHPVIVKGRRKLKSNRLTSKPKNKIQMPSDTDIQSQLKKCVILKKQVQ